MRRPKAFSWWPGHPKYSVGGNPARVHLTRHASSEYFRLYPADAPPPPRRNPGNLFRRISMPLGDYTYMSCLCHRHRRTETPCPTSSLPKFALTYWLPKKFAKFRNIRKILEFQGASFTWQWKRPRNYGQGESSSSRRLILAGEAKREREWECQSESACVCQQTSRSSGALRTRAYWW